MWGKDNNFIEVHIDGWSGRSSIGMERASTGTCTCASEYEHHIHEHSNNHGSKIKQQSRDLLKQETIPQHYKNGQDAKNIHNEHRDDSNQELRGPNEVRAQNKLANTSKNTNNTTNNNACLFSHIKTMAKTLEEMENELDRAKRQIELMNHMRKDYIEDQIKAKHAMKECVHLLELNNRKLLEKKQRAKQKQNNLDVMPGWKQYSFQALGAVTKSLLGTQSKSVS